MRNESSVGGLFSILKGVGLALVSSLVLTVIFANLLRTGKIPDGAIYPVNQAIKVFSVALGGLFFVRGERGWLKGGVIGLLFTMLSYLTFSAIGGDFALSWIALVELLIGLLSGALCGIIAVNLQR